MPAEWEKESRHAVGAGHLPLVASMTYHRGVARSLGERSRRSRDAEKRDAVLPSDDACPLRRWGQGWEAGVEMAPELAEAHARLHELEAAAAHPGRFDGGEGDPRVEAARALVEFLDRAEACLRELPPPGQPT